MAAMTNGGLTQASVVSRSLLDDAVRRILRVKLRLGLFEAGKPSQRPLGGKFELLGAPAHRAVARQAVRESLVLLKNQDNLLPIKGEPMVLRPIRSLLAEPQVLLVQVARRDQDEERRRAGHLYRRPAAAGGRWPRSGAAGGYRA